MRDVLGSAADRESRTGTISLVPNKLLNRRLVGVDRLSWDTARGPGRREVGPVRLVFDDGRSLVLNGTSRWSLEFRVTSPGDASWLDAYDYDIGDGRWVRRDAAESPFADVVGARLTAWDPVYNEMQETVGLRLRFGAHELLLALREGEVTTP